MVSIGLTIPQRASMFGVGSTAELLGLARKAEESGLFDTVWVGDSLTSKARTDSLACLGALAGMTTSVRLAVGCMASFPVRDPALFAYQWASLDEVSGGRMLLAVCNGLQKRDSASEREGAHFGGVPDKERARRLEEYVNLVRQIWTGRVIDFQGSFVQYEGLQILPRPVQDPCPIWISANPPEGPAAARVLRRVATMADGLLTTRSAPGYLGQLKERLFDELRESGRNPEDFPLAVYHSINVGPDRDACLAEAIRFFNCYYGEGVISHSMAESMTAAGSVPECIRQLRAVQDEGANHITIRLASWEPQKQLQMLIEEILPALLAE
jgi:alkanesulfonate monooxygenase SsuD/methylene tetrahydromethanopterin reductase-like flavin-dependent oxidoreductase (luciferase family)